VPVVKNSDSIVYRNNVSWTGGEATLPCQEAVRHISGVAMGYLLVG
jgi:hypothetical protein